MGNQPMDDPRLAEAIEACRPGSDDLSDPGLAFLAGHLAADPALREAFERLKRLDASLAEAFQDVPVPEGLAGQIAARLAATLGRQSTSVGEQHLGATAAPEPIAEVPKPRRRVSRRWLLAGAGSLAAVAASAAVALLVLWPEGEALTPAQVCQTAEDYFEGDWDQQGQFAAQVQPPDAYPAGADFDVRRFPQMRWRPVRDFLGHRGAAYDLTPPGARRATLYVVKCTVPGLPTVPPLRPTRATGNRSVGAWQTGGLLHVLVVEGGRQTYRDFLPRRTWT